MIKFDRRLLANFDWLLLLALLAVAVMGLANLYSATHTDHGAGTPIYLKQLYFYILGTGLIIGIISVDYRTLLSWNYPFYIGIICLLLVALLLGKSISGSSRWINLGFFNLQPSEPAKLVLVISLASYYYRKDTGKGFSLLELGVPIILTAIPFILILKQPDLGTALILAFIFVSMTLFVKLKWSTLIALVSAGASIIPIAWAFFLKPYQKQRVLTFLNPEADPLNSGYHIMQSKIAVGSGAKLGKGFLHGTQAHLSFLPENHTDFAFSVWAEEWGFVGCLLLLAGIFFLVLLSLKIAIASRDKFGVLLAFGIASLIFWEAFINLAMVMGLLPVVGIPLPLVSYGGSSLFTILASIGILFNIRMRRFMVTIK